MRLVSYSQKSLLAGTRSSMLPTDDSLLSVKLVHSTTTYWPNGMTKTLDSGDSEDKLKVKFAISGVTIASGSSIQVLVTGIINPPSTVPLRGFKMNFFTSVDYGNSATTSTLNYLQIGYFNTCDRLLTEQASANAILGYHTVGLSAAQYRFRFRTANTYPNKSGLQVTMPSGYSLQSASSYTLTCLAGCTASNIAATKANSNVLTFADCFEGQLTSGAVVDLIISGWQNPVTESVMRVSFATVWDTSADYTIDKFESLGDLASSDAPLSTPFSTTRILIIDPSARATADCVVKAPQLALSSVVWGTVGAQPVETVAEKFVASGSACGSRGELKLTAFAELENGTRLLPKYAVASFNGTTGLIEVTLTPSADSNAQSNSHAVYVQVTDAKTSLATNTICFMVVKDKLTVQPDFCKSYCKRHSLASKKGYVPFELDYLVKTTESVTVTYTDEFTHVSSNPVQCPVLHSNSSPGSPTALSNYDVATGGFKVMTSSSDFVLSNGQRQETQSFIASTEAYSKTMPFSIFFHGCSDAFLIPKSNFKITAVLAKVGDSITYSSDAVGFQSSDPTNCPLGSALPISAVDFCDFSDCTKLSKADMWVGEGTSLRVTRSAATPMATPTKIKVTARFGTPSISIVNIITLQIDTVLPGSFPSTCDLTSWGCQDTCDVKDLTLNVALLSTATQAAIKSQTFGCSKCAANFFLEYTKVEDFFVRKCSAVPKAQMPASLAAGQPCDLGLLNDDDLKCTKPCSDFMDGCALCSSKTECQLCSDTTKSPLTFTDASGNSYSVCKSLENICANCQTSCATIPNCAVCSGNACQGCKPGYALIGSSCSQITATEATYTYYVAAATADKVYFSEAELTTINSNTGSETSKLQFIQQVFNKVYSDASLATLQKVTVNVILDIGDHFVFSCYTDLYATYSASYSTADYTDLCARVPSLRQVYPSTDNVEFVIKPTFGTTTTIHVLDSHFNFNVTGSLTFENIKFRGESALARPVSPTATLSYPPLATIPIKKCTVLPVKKCDSLPELVCGSASADATAETWGTHKKLEFELNARTKLTNLFTCTDSGFQEATVPMTAKESCVQGVQSSSVESVRACPGEPYHADFFTQDSSSKIYYKRHRVLFNLYNFDRVRASSTAKQAKLVLKGCKFHYFLDNYEALINVETNNMAVSPALTQTGKNYIVELGDDRGVSLSLEKSTFAHSRFCKGMIVFKKKPILASTTSTIVSSLNNAVPKPSEDNSLIDISGSTFENLNFGRVLKTLSLLDGKTYPISGLSSVAYPAFDNHGSVLNLQGFPGGVKIAESTIKNNLVFIPDVYPSWREPTEPREQISDFVNTNTGQVMTTRCNSTSIVRRLFSDYLNSLREQPSHELSQLEKHSPIYISLNRQPVIIELCTFENNVGLFGGSVSIDTPNFFGDVKDLARSQPYIIINDNNFTYSQSYLSGNAVYFRATRQRLTKNENEEVCGAGVSLQTNVFLENTPVLHSSNGGAISLECDFVSSKSALSTGGSSEKLGQGAFQTIQVSDYLAGVDGTVKIYKVYRNAASVAKNTFTRNSVGQKGSAVYARQISNLVIQDNTFDFNRPAMALYQDLKNLPYQRLLLAKTFARPVLYHNPDPALLRNINEWEYLRLYAKSYSEGGLIPLSQLQGAIYTESCQSCLISHSVSFETENGCEFCHTLPQNTLVQGNTFKDNDDGISFFEAESLPRASVFMAKGGKNYAIQGNAVSYQASPYYGSAFYALGNYYNWLPRNFWTSLHAPLFRLDTPRGITVTFASNKVSSIATVMPLFEKLHFKASLVQVDNAPSSMTLSVNQNEVDDIVIYGGDASLFYADGAALQATGNKFSRIGLIDQSYHNFTIVQNYKRTATYFPLDTVLQSKRTWTQSRGVFWLKGAVRKHAKTLEPQKHLLHANNFEFLFCQSGCVVTHEVPDRGHPIYMEIQNNTFSHVFGLQAAILDATISSPQTDDFTFAVYNVTDSALTNVKNGGLKIRGSTNNAVLMMQRVNFTDCFGNANDAVVDLAQGHLFLCKACNVSGHTYWQFSTLNDTFRKSFNTYQLLNRTNFTDYLPEEQAESLFKPSRNQKGVVALQHVSATSLLTRDTAFRDVVVDGERIGKRLASEYQFVTERTYEAPNQSATLIFWYAKQFQYDVYLEWVKGNPDFLPFSLVTNSTFEDLAGVHAVLAVEDVHLEIRTTSFSKNQMVGPEGSTLRALASRISLTSAVTFHANQASMGGALFLSHNSSLYSFASEFTQNQAILAGVFLLREASDVTLVKNSVHANRAVEVAAVIWASNGHETTEISATDTSFSDNYAGQAFARLDSVRLHLFNCVLLNNTAQEVTSGFYTANSFVNLTNTLIRNEPLNKTGSRKLHDTGLLERSGSELRELFRGRRLQEQTMLDEGILAGFFYLTGQSHLELDYTQVLGTSGRVASAIYLTTGSAAVVSNTRVERLEAPTGCQYENSGVIVGQLGSLIKVTNSEFFANACSYIFSDRTPVQVSDSVFNDGMLQPYINMRGSVLQVNKVTFKNALKDKFVVGKAIKCVDCTQVFIKESSFSNLYAQKGGALFLQDIGSGKIVDSTFTNNTALQGGAIFIANSNITATDNVFVKNKAQLLNQTALQQSNTQEYSQRTGRGGAIYLTCLKDNALTQFANKSETECIPQDFTLDNIFRQNVAGSGEGYDVYYADLNNTEGEVVTVECLDIKIGNLCVAQIAWSVELELSETDQFQSQFTDWEQSALKNDQTRGGVVFTSGHTIRDLRIKLLDKSGNVLVGDNSSLAELYFEKVPQVSSLSGAVAVAQMGVFVFPSLDLSFQPNSSQILRLKLSVNEPYAQFLSFLGNGAEPFNFVFKARACTKGEEYTPENECQICPNGHFSFTPLTEVSQCPPCPQFGVCKEGELYPSAGYVRLERESEVFVRCFNSQACREGDSDHPLQNCDEQYEGVMCAECSKQNWRLLGTPRCYMCASDGVQTFSLFALPVLFLLFVMWLTNMYLKKSALLNQRWSATLRIFFNLNQIMNIFILQTDDLSLVVPNLYLKAYMDYRVHLISPVNWLINLQCQDHQLSLSKADKFYYTLYAYVLLPGVLLLLNFIVWTVYMRLMACCGDSKFECKMLVNNVAISFGISMFLVLPSINILLVQAFGCFPSLSDVEGTKDVFVDRLLVSPDVVCEGTRYYLSAILAAVFLITWNLVIPSIVLRRMAAQATSIYVSATVPTSHQSLTQQAEINDIKSRYGFFFSGLNLGGDITATQSKDNAKNNSDAEKNQEERSLSTRCRSFFSWAAKPVLGGVLVQRSVQPSRDEVVELTNSFYYWEFLMHFKKLFLTILIIAMSQLGQALQSIIVMVIILIFFVIQIRNKQAYYNAQLQNLNILTWMLIFVYSFSRVVVRSTSLDGSQTGPVKELVSIEGEELPEVFRTISRSPVFSSSDNYLIQIAMLVPVLLFYTVIDLYFLQQACIYILCSIVQSRRLGLFSRLTCNMIRVADFRQKYMLEENEKDEVGDGMQDEGPDLTLKKSAVKDEKDPLHDEIVDPNQVKPEISEGEAGEREADQNHRVSKKQKFAPVDDIAKMALGAGLIDEKKKKDQAGKSKGRKILKEARKQQREAKMREEVVQLSPSPSEHLTVQTESPALFSSMHSSEEPQQQVIPDSYGDNDVVRSQQLIIGDLPGRKGPPRADQHSQKDSVSDGLESEQVSQKFTLKASHPIVNDSPLRKGKLKANEAAAQIMQYQKKIEDQDLEDEFSSQSEPEDRYQRKNKDRSKRRDDMPRQLRDKKTSERRDDRAPKSSEPVIQSRVPAAEPNTKSRVRFQTKKLPLEELDLKDEDNSNNESKGKLVEKPKEEASEQQQPRQRNYRGNIFAKKKRFVSNSPSRATSRPESGVSKSVTRKAKQKPREGDAAKRSRD